jgi:UDP-N-acetylmuramate dehydrogenase
VSPAADQEVGVRAILDALPEVAEADVPLARYSWLGVGGPADVLVVAGSRDQLELAIRLAHQYGLPWHVYGGLTNMLLPDSGLRGIVVLNRARAVHFEKGYRLQCDSGAIVVQVAREAIERGWGGLTWAVGLPGTIGGAVVNNAGAFGGEISRVLVSADVFTPSGEVSQVPASWFDFRYRCSKLKGAGERWLVLASEFRLRAADSDELRAKAEEYSLRRTRSQPPGRTLGSTFKNPPGDYAGRLIEAAGLKGTRCGGMAVSERHANFFMNEGGATAADFRALLDRVQSEVHAQFGVQLEPEIEILPEG